MSDGLVVRVEGGAKVHGELQRLVREAKGHQLEAAAKSAALLVTNLWKELAPYRTGTYRGSIHVEVEEVDDDHVLLWIGTDIVDPPYPIFLEYGTVRMAPRPSATPAWDESQEPMKEEIRRALEILLRV